MNIPIIAGSDEIKLTTTGNVNPEDSLERRGYDPDNTEFIVEREIDERINQLEQAIRAEWSGHGA